MKLEARVSLPTPAPQIDSSSRYVPKRATVLSAAMVVTLAALTYVWWVHNYLVADSWSLIGAISQPDWDAGDLLPFQLVPHRINSTYYYAPVSTAVLWFAFKLGGYSPERYHVLVLLTHALTTLLLYTATLRLTGGRLKATLAASIFAVHFANTEAVGWFGGYTHPLVGLFGAASLVFYVEFLSDRRMRWQVLSLVALTAGALTQATAFSWFAVIACAELVFGHARDNWPGTVRRLAPLAVVPLAILPAQFQAFHMGPSGYQYRLGSWVILNVFYYPLSTLLPSLEPRAFGLARDLQLATTHQDAFARLMGMSDAFVLLIASAMFIPTAILLWTRGGPVVRFALLSFTVSLTPFLLINGQGYRYLYTPLMFFSIAVASSVVDLANRLRGASGLSSAAVLAIIPIFVVFSFAESQRQMFWWQQAGLVAHESLQQVQALQPSLPTGAKLVFGGVPDTLPGTDAEVWRQGFGEALQAIYGDRTLRVEAYSTQDVEKLFKNELKGAPDTYGFIWENWHFRQIQP